MVIGRNARRLRTGAGLTLDQVSIAARRRGLKWSESRVADFEAGRVAPNLGTVAAICLALADAGCAEGPALLTSDGPIQINTSLTLRGEDVANLLCGRPIEEPKPVKSAERHPSNEPPTLEEVIGSSGATEERISKSLGISSTYLAMLSASYWNGTFSQERDRRAGEGANAQKRGQVTRQMKAELEAAIAAIEAATHGDDK
jgi:transcriptional regulator with XRE-family HTH domain